MKLPTIWIGIATVFFGINHNLIDIQQFQILRIILLFLAGIDFIYVIYLIGRGIYPPKYYSIKSHLVASFLWIIAEVLYFMAAYINRDKIEFCTFLTLVGLGCMFVAYTEIKTIKEIKNAESN